MKKALFILILFCNTGLYSQSNPDYEKVSKVCELWGLIKYFDPGKPADKFDSAFAAQVPKMLKAVNESEWRNLITEWLNVLNDRSTRVITNEKFKEGELKSEFTNDSLLIVKISGSKLFDDWHSAKGFVSGLIDQSKKAKGIIFDLRQESEIPQNYEGFLNYNFDFLGLNKHFATNIIPQFKRIYYSGFKPEGRISSGGYSIKDVVENSMSIGNYTSDNPKVAWIVNKFSELPGVSLSQQASGSGSILSDTESIDQLLPLSNTFRFSESIIVKFRTAEIILPATYSLKADNLYSASENPIEKARAIIMNFKSNTTREDINHKPVLIESLSLYPTDSYPTIGYRILAAAKIYTIIQTFFPYHQYMDKNWNQVLKESIPDFVSAQNEVEYGLAVAKMYANIQDSHGFISGNKGQQKLRGEAPSPISVDWIENKVVVTRLRNDSICKINGINIGDVILKVNGVTTERLMEKYRIYYAHSTKQAIDQTAAQFCVRGAEGESGTFTIRDNKGKIRDIKLSWSNSHNKNFVIKNSLDTLELLNGNIGYADLTRMEAKQTDKMFDKFKNTKAIIFDMRGYPNGTAWSIAPRLTERQNVPLAMFRKTEVLVPNIVMGDLVSNKSYTEFIQTVASSDKWKYKGKTVMLINHNAISQSEHTGLFFEAVNNTTFIGSPTAGANGDVTNFIIPGGMSLSFSGQGVWHADGRQLQRLGLQPHVTIKPTIKGIRSGKDEVLDKATEWINENVR